MHPNLFVVIVRHITGTLAKGSLDFWNLPYKFRVHNFRCSGHVFVAEQKLSFYLAPKCRPPSFAG